MVWYNRPADVEVAAATYQFFTDRVPGAEGMEFLIESPFNPNDLSDPYYEQFNRENRYINFANNLGSFGEGRPSFEARYGSLTYEDTIRTAYTEVVGRAPTEGEFQFFLDARSYYEAVAVERGVVSSGVPQAQATKVVAIGSILNEAVKANVGPYAVAIRLLVDDVAGDGASDLLSRDIINNTNYTTPSFLLTDEKDFANSQQSWTQTAANQQPFRFTDANNRVVAASSTNLGQADELRDASTADRDLLEISASGANPLNLSTVANVENIEVEFSSYSGGAVNLATVTGAQTLDLDGTLGAAIPEFTGVQNSGVTTLDGSGLISTNLGITVNFNGAAAAIGRTILGGQGPDTLSGSNFGDPSIFGGDGADLLDGFGGDDRLRGGRGDDTVTTGGGARDRIAFEATASENGRDVIPTGTTITFTVGQDGDQLDFSAFTARGGGVGTSTTVVRAAGPIIDPISAMEASVVVFAADTTINSEAQIEAIVGDRLMLGATRSAVVLVQEGVDTRAYYVQTGAAGTATPADVNLVATLQNATSASLTVDNFLV